MEQIKTEGIVINAIPFRNYDCILTVFTPLEGLITLFFRGAYRSKKGNGSGVTTPLSVVDLVYAKGKGDLYTCVEIVVINHHLPLRSNLAILEGACDMIKAISKTQLPGKSSPELYQLLLIYLAKLPSVTFPQVLTCSFRLKILRYEGLFADSDTPIENFPLTTEEQHTIEHLAFCRDFSQLTTLNITGILSKKIYRLFDESFDS